VPDPSRTLRLLVYRTFYALPMKWRRRLVRMGTAGYTIGAVTIVRDADASEPGRILLLRQPPGPGWSIPGGLVNRGEFPAHGAARELAEESGIRLDPGELRPATPNAVVHTRGRWIDLVFEASVRSDVEFRVDEVEVHEAAWHPIDDLPRLTGATARLLAHYGIGPLRDDPKDD
jgi:8-oxo-dGTP pyrophosphatase MutT (NUDIX family)